MGRQTVSAQHKVKVWCQLLAGQKPSGVWLEILVLRLEALESGKAFLVAGSTMEVLGPPRYTEMQTSIGCGANFHPARSLPPSPLCKMNLA